MQPLQIYQQRLQQFEQETAAWHKQYNAVSWIRVFVFLAGVAGTIILYQMGIATYLIAGYAFVCLGLFLFFMKKHNQIAYTRNQFRNLVTINQDEINRLQGKHYPPETGQLHADAAHPYATDLDIFGRSSLFTLLNRTTTWGGNLLLANWLKYKAPVEQIHQRQQAVQELASQLGWQQEFQATGMHAKTASEDLELLLQWINTKSRIKPQKLLVALIYVMPVLTLTAIGLAIFTDITYHLPALCILINWAILGFTFREVKDASEQTSKSAHILKIYANLLKIIENSTFTSAALQRLKEQLKYPHSTASAKIKQLSSLLYSLEARQNAYFYMVVSSTTLWDLFFLLRLETWKEQVTADIQKWLDTVSEAEVLSSLAAYSHANPTYVMPVISPDDLYLEAQNMAHPLIVKGEAVSNSVSLQGKGKTIVVTGSNMSGKSTFLRTVGINAVLAMAGAPVRASYFAISLCQVFTSMRTQDSLEESTSSFYAELKRLKQLIDSLPSNKPILYLLDEILKGTNSHDRHLGAQALIRQLHKHNASGFISTHDLALGEMAEELPGSVFNYSFNSEIVNDKLYFDYKLRQGVCQSFNASKLMQQIGIEME
ncbi:DNA mismatch repair protein MutS [Rhodocytophaga aerolata]|uniref:DNA mismatch repair protein MutS n=1 Tax=Rhodocytophaga aerolata TaxID=455078 RepID=A0ABT8R9R8_9BACT|nr:MutS family DNA mismatch repair protein [Rhodocytophaga aerolata]MDO1448822.1 DNA mismatch repair protein MutS [Rhodocytophaga aerolata]